MIPCLRPGWPAPTSVRALVTTREGGVSAPPFHGLNLAGHVGDDPYAVARNRALLRREFGLPSEPRWLEQVHGRAVVELDGSAAAPPCADAAVTSRPGVVCAVLTADCLPVLFCDRAGGRVAAVHAGWRGLRDGVLEAAVAAMARPGDELLAWMGPAIGPGAFEVGEEVRDAFVVHDPAARAAFRPHRRDRFLADLYRLARQRLARCGVGYVGGGGYCTVTESERFFSYRRDGRCGRMASLIWIEAPSVHARRPTSPDISPGDAMIVPRWAFSSGFPTESIASLLMRKEIPLEGVQIGARARPALAW